MIGVDCDCLNQIICLWVFVACPVDVDLEVSSDIIAALFSHRSFFSCALSQIHTWARNQRVTTRATIHGSVHSTFCSVPRFE